VEHSQKKHLEQRGAGGANGLLILRTPTPRPLTDRHHGGKNERKRVSISLSGHPHFVDKRFHSVGLPPKYTKNFSLIKVCMKQLNLVR